MVCVPTLCRFAKALPHLAVLNLRSNALRAFSEWSSELTSLTTLQQLDIRYNPKLKTVEVAALAIPTLTVLDGEWDSDVENEDDDDGAGNDRGDSGAARVMPAVEERNACVWPSLQEQLSPLSTPELRARLFDSFGVDVPVRDGPKRARLMALLLECYARHNRGVPSSAEGANADGAGGAVQDLGESARPIVHTQGETLPPELAAALLAELRTTTWPNDRPKVWSAGYLVLERDPSDTRRGRSSNSKRGRHTALWKAACDCIQHIDPDSDHTAVAFSNGFRGSPHIDGLDSGMQWVVSLGDWEPEGGGALCVEADPNTVAVINTRGRPILVDGRFPHWVSPWRGSERFSVVWFRTGGENAPLCRFRVEPEGTSAETQSTCHK